MVNTPTRRRYLELAAGGVSAVLAGCSMVERSNSGTESSEDIGDLPVRDPDVPLAYDLDAYANNLISGGVSRDDIPSIDTPRFGDVAAGDEQISPGHTVFGVERNGETKAYPQRILVRHEVVNDEFGGDGVALTYCPLVEATLGFERGDVQFGVSGQLVNSNLVLYDRASESLWPQVLATCVRGELKGKALNEFPVTVSTWQCWKNAHPETKVLLADSRYGESYENDTYGNPASSGSYFGDQTIAFETMHQDDRFPWTNIVLGARGTDGPVAFDKSTLQEAHLLEANVGGSPYLSVYDHQLDTGYVYRNPEDTSFESTGELYERSDGETYAATDLPLPEIRAFEIMWYSWVGYYPNTTAIL